MRALQSRSRLAGHIAGIVWLLLMPSLAAAPAKERIVKMGSLDITLSEPVSVARSKGYCWFPSLVRLRDGSLLALMSDYADMHTKESTALASWSLDGGATWSPTVKASYGDSALPLASGDIILLPYYLYPRTGGMGAPYQRIPRGEHALEKGKGEVTVTGWPRPDRSFAPELGLSGFVFNGQTVRLKDGSYLATLYGYYEKAQRYNLIAVTSKSGTDWQYLTAIAGDACPLEGAEGPCESALCRLKDGRLMCVFRLASNVPFGQCWSEDEGRTWSKPVVMDGPFSVQPSLAALPDGTTALSGGRPGVFVWINEDGKGTRWEKIDIGAHHTACKPEEPLAGSGPMTSSYTEIVALDSRNLLVVYDRIPSGWEPIPQDSKETNSVWVVRIGLPKRIAGQ
ncbi:MAG: exo-alpha-sialidase [Armatimonadetes bacterium]|nr:exo-alpha-sialidase [Armatimonadota bacterium]